MPLKIQIQDVLAQQEALLIDVRSPSEYEKGHLPGALSLPLLDNEERCLVGTVYHQQGKEAAKVLGLQTVGPKLACFAEKIKIWQQGRKDKRVIFYCWRGGMRSSSVASVMEMMGFSTFQLIGGYKKYRQYVLDCLDQLVLPAKIIVVSGGTGAGKTLLLQKLKQQGYPVIDLEKLANHRGSAFGHIGKGEPITSHQFDQQLLAELEQYACSEYLLLECESRRIGNVFLPARLYRAMQQAERILIRASLETRVDRIIEEYTGLEITNLQVLQQSIGSLHRHLGKKKSQDLQEWLALGKIREVVTVLITEYYDVFYKYDGSEGSYLTTVWTDDMDTALDQMTHFLNTMGR